MIKLPKRASKKFNIKHSFLRGAMLLWFIVLQLSVFAQTLIVKDSIIQTTCDPKTKGAIYLKVSGGTPPYTFKWDNGSDKSFIEKLNGGTYKVEVVDKKGYLFKEHYDIKKAKPIAFNTISYYCDSNRHVYESTGTKYVVQNTVRSYISFDNVMYPIQMTSYYTKDTTNKTTNLEEYFNEKIIPHNYKSARDFLVELPLKSHIHYNFETVKDKLYNPNYFERIRIVDFNGCVLDTFVQAQGGRKFEFMNLDSIPEDYPCTTLIANQNRIEYNKYVHQDSIREVKWVFNAGSNHVQVYYGKDLVIPPLKSDVRLIITHNNGCYQERDITIDCDYDINKFVFFPTAFSPNGDGINDLFFLNSVSGIVNRIERIAVYNRWGVLVYEQKDIDPNDTTQGWDGLVRGIDATSDVYACYAELRLYDGSTKVVKGNAMLVR